MQNDWILKLDLKPHPEGGYFRETYRSVEKFSAQGLPNRFSGERVCSTAIYYLLEQNDFSAFHRIKSDELWHFYDGSTVLIHTLDPSGKYTRMRLGRDLDKNEQPQTMIPHGVWFAAELADKTSYALAGCTVAPGFDFGDFEMGDRDELLKQFGQHAEIILKLTQ